MTANPVIVIPARMASTRLPGKPLADIDGRAMILRVMDAATAAAIGPVLVAAGDAEIADAVRADGGLAVLTDPDLPSGSDRVLAALNAVDADRAHDPVINLQGDEPEFPPDALRRLMAVFAAAPDTDVATLVVRDDAGAAAQEPNIVKAVLADADGPAPRALYFTRAPAPHGPGPVWRHVGVYAWRRAALERFCALPPSPLEKRERLEQLRALEAGMTIRVALLDSASEGVDTPEDLARARARIAGGATAAQD